MPTISLSGFIDCVDCEERTLRADLLSLLFRKGWNINNGNGDHLITLNNIEQRIIEADAFLFTPHPNIADMFHAISVFVGYQTCDPHLDGLPTVLMNRQGSWNRFFSVLDRLHEQGTIRQNHQDFLIQVQDLDEIIPALNNALNSPAPDAGRGAHSQTETKHSPPQTNTPPPSHLLANVCVFCSASIEDEDQLQAGYEVGKLLAQNNLGCVSGAGKTGIMGTVVAGNVEAGGWAAGSNVPHIIELEGLPKGLSTFWPRPDIYTRMEVMIENAQVFLILPGGAGTVQELLALLLLLNQKDPLMRGKSIIIYNPQLPNGRGFWDQLVPLLEYYRLTSSFQMITELDQLIPAIKSTLT